MVVVKVLGKERCVTVDVRRGDPWLMLDVVNAWLLNWWIRYAVLSVLLGIAFHLGFERPLPLLKRILVYILLVFLAFPLVVLSYVLPMIGVLILTIIVLFVYRLRRPKVNGEKS